MKKEKLIASLQSLHRELNHYLESVQEADLNRAPKSGQWSKAEEIGHLIVSLQQTNRGLGLPKFFMRYKFGTNNRQERSYDEVVAKYRDKLATVPIPTNPFQLRQKTVHQKEKLQLDYLKAQRRFEKRINRFTETDLSKLLLPHPLLGRMTLREFLYFTHYHTTHHFEHIQIA